MQQGFLPREVAFRIGAAARELPGFDLGMFVRVLIRLTENQLTLEGFERVGPRALRDALREVQPTRSADAHRAVQRLRTEESRFRDEEPVVAGGDVGPDSEWLLVGFTSNEGHWMDASLTACRRVLVYRVGPSGAPLVGVRRARTSSGLPMPQQERIDLVQDCDILYTLLVGGAAMSTLVRAGVHVVKTTHAVPCGHWIHRLQAVVRQAPPPWMRKAMRVNGTAAGAPEAAANTPWLPHWRPSDA